MSDAFGGGSDPKVEQKSTLTDEQRKLLDRLNQVLLNQISPSGQVQGVAPPPFDFIAGESPLQSTTFGLAADYLAAGQSPEEQAAYQKLIAGQGVPEATPENFQKYFDQGVADPTIRQFEEQFIPLVEKRYGESGRSGALQTILTRGARDLATNLGAMRAEYGKAGLEAQIASSESALNRIIPGITAQRESVLSPLRVGEVLGGEQRSIEGQQLAGDLSSWLFSNPAFNPYLTQFLGPALGTQAFQLVGFPGTPSQTGNTLGGIGGILGGVGGILGGGGGGGGGGII